MPAIYKYIYIYICICIYIYIYIYIPIPCITTYIPFYRTKTILASIQIWLLMSRLFPSWLVILYKNMFQLFLVQPAFCWFDSGSLVHIEGILNGWPYHLTYSSPWLMVNHLLTSTSNCIDYDYDLTSLHKKEAMWGWFPQPSTQYKVASRCQVIIVYQNQLDSLLVSLQLVLACCNMLQLSTISPLYPHKARKKERQKDW